MDEIAFTPEVLPWERLGAPDILKHRGEIEKSRISLIQRYDLSLLDAPLIGDPFACYVLLTEMPQLFQNETRSKSQLFLSRYYWFRRFWWIRYYMTGFDAGFEEQEEELISQAAGLSHSADLIMSMPACLGLIRGEATKFVQYQLDLIREGSLHVPIPDSCPIRERLLNSRNS